jgi:hypothetical protein
VRKANLKQYRAVDGKWQFVQVAEAAHSRQGALAQVTVS